MKRKIDIIYYLCALVILSSCTNDENFENKAFFKEKNKVENIIIKSSATNIERTIHTAIAKPITSDIQITYKVDSTLVNKYNEANEVKAIMLPQENYEMPTKKVKITTGSVLSSGSNLLFKNINKLNRDLIYILPVKILDAENLEILESASVKYFVFKGGALINVVADIEKNYLYVNWKNPEACNNLRAVTMEALIYCKSFDKMISTIMGIEGRFLLRIGDIKFPSNQIQFVSGTTNFPNQDESKGLTINQWNHVALTYDFDNKQIKIYINGSLQSSGEAYLFMNSLNLAESGENGFFIGYSYRADRDLAGYISECRVWNRARSMDEILKNMYEVDPHSKGLVAYWKFDEGDGIVVKDHTENENDAIAKSPLKWIPVSINANNQNK